MGRTLGQTTRNNTDCDLGGIRLAYVRIVVAYSTLMRAFKIIISPSTDRADEAERVVIIAT